MLQSVLDATRYTRMDLSTSNPGGKEMPVKKIVVVGTLLLLAITLVGCGAPKPTATAPDIDTSGSTLGTVVEVDPKQVEELIQTDTSLVILDVSGKWADGHIVGALDTPLDKLQGIINSNVTLDASKHYVVYSHDETSSKAAADMLIKNSFMVLNRLVGGYDAWVAYGGYTEK